MLRTEANNAYKVRGLQTEMSRCEGKPRLAIRWAGPVGERVAQGYKPKAHQ